MEEHADKRGTQVLIDIAGTVTAALIDKGVAADEARKLGLEAADAVRKTYGGEQLYIPKGLCLVVSERDREIWHQFNGSNTFALAKQHGITERQIYAIVARVREEDFQKRQGNLFG